MSIKNKSKTDGAMNDAMVATSLTRLTDLMEASAEAEVSAAKELQGLWVSFDKDADRLGTGIGRDWRARKHEFQPPIRFLLSSLREGGFSRKESEAVARATDLVSRQAVNKAASSVWHVDKPKSDKPEKSTLERILALVDKSEDLTLRDAEAISTAIVAKLQ